MAQFNAENERMKRQYLGWLKDADGKDEKTLDHIAAAMHDFECVLGFRPFKAFHRDWARRYKNQLDKSRHHRTGKPLSLTTRDARLRHVKAFFKWLASQPGYRSRIAYTDVEYFNNNDKDARAAHARRPVQFPSIQQCAHAFRNMAHATDVQCRDRAIFALLMLTGARDSALASLRLQHVDLVERMIFQDGRNVDTKNSSTFETWFMPVEGMYLEAFEDWVNHLRDDLLFGPGDALFPKLECTVKDGCFTYENLSRDPFASGQPINTIIRAAFRAVDLHPFTPHSFRKTLIVHLDSICKTRESFKALSQNLGHEHAATTINSYLPVSRERQRDLIRSLKNDD